MAEMTAGEPQSAADYDDRTTTAVKTVLIEIGQILGSFKGKFAIVGGVVRIPAHRDRSFRRIVTADSGPS